MEDVKIIALMEGYGTGTLTEAEEIVFFQWYSDASLEDFHRIFSQCTLQTDLPESPALPEKLRMQLEQAIREQEAGQQGQVIPIQRRYRLGWAAAILLCISVGGYLLFHTRQSAPAAYTNNSAGLPPSNDIAPGTTKAVLTLADGSQVSIDSARSGQLAVQGSMTVQNQGGLITYNSNKQPGLQKANPDQLYNTLTTNRGEQSPALTLSDGTKVWLNALSSIRYPVAFSGNSREVEITGEVYFEIARNASMPFHVKAKEMNIEVLGTQFNINAYPGEPDARTTLLEGSIRINATGTEAGSLVHDQLRSLVLVPGQQARVKGGISLVLHPDIEQAVAWKKGLFDFTHANLQTVLRQLARWYDIDVKFEGNVPIRSFHGKITRDLNLSQVLQLLQDVDVKFRIEGRTLIVTH